MLIFFTFSYLEIPKPCLSLVKINNKAMKNTLQVINYIASNPQFEKVLINEDNERTPIQAIELLSSEGWSGFYRINSTLIYNTLIIVEIPK